MRAANVERIGRVVAVDVLRRSDVRRFLGGVEGKGELSGNSLNLAR